MAANVIGVIIAAILLFGGIVTAVFWRCFSESFEEEFSESSYHMADTASVLVDGDHIDEYLAGEEMEEYWETKEYLDIFCQRMNVSLIYVIQVDTSDYGSFVSVFNCVNNSADDTNYTEWELGHREVQEYKGYRCSTRRFMNTETYMGRFSKSLRVPDSSLLSRHSSRSWIPAGRYRRSSAFRDPPVSSMSFWSRI